MKITTETVRGTAKFVLDMGTFQGRRQRKYFDTEAKAAQAKRKAEQDQRAGGQWWAALPVQEKDSFIMVLKEIRAAGLSVRGVWEGFRAGSPASSDGSIQTRSLKEAIAECVQSKRQANRREIYIENLEDRLNEFARGREETPVHRITVQDVSQWVFVPGQKPVTILTRRKRLSALFEFCLRRGYATTNPCARVEAPAVDYQPPLILSPKQTAQALRLAKAELPQVVPYLALGLFAGIRPAELDRLGWEAMDLERAIVTVDAAASKVRQRRIVNLEPVAVEWLKLARDSISLPLPHAGRQRALRKLLPVLGFAQWPTDLLRHTAASYLLAKYQDAGKVALQLGNSPGVLMRHYRELVPREDAEAFFKLTPATVEQASE